MRTPAMSLLFSLLAVLAAACGEPFTYVQGTSGTGGNAGGGGATGTTSTTSGVHKCDPRKPNACGGGKHCETTDCKNGVCVANGPSEGLAWSPVCGCDGVAYWNADLPIAHGMGFTDAASGSCDLASPPAWMPTCTIKSASCPLGTSCFVHLTNDLCATAAEGVCMGVPDCESTTPTVLVCGSAECQNLCKAIVDGKTWLTPAVKVCDPPAP